MNKPYLLIVEDDIDISNMLKIYFSGQGYDADIAHRGGDALEKVRQRLPDAIVEDIMLPDIDGYEVCRKLRTDLSTSQIPVLFLTQKDERSDRLQGLELGADDYITKPFDIEEFKLRVKRQIQKGALLRHTQPVTGLPSGILIETQLQSLLTSKTNWAVLDINIRFYDAFREVYGDVAGDDLLRFTAGLLHDEVLRHSRIPDVFIGHVKDGHFIACVEADQAVQIRDVLKAQFTRKVPGYYAWPDREHGFLRTTGPDGQERYVPLAKLEVGVLLLSEQRLTNIHEIARLATAARLNDSQ